MFASIPPFSLLLPLADPSSPPSHFWLGFLERGKGNTAAAHYSLTSLSPLYLTSRGARPPRQRHDLTNPKMTSPFPKPDHRKSNLAEWQPSCCDQFLKKHVAGFFWRCIDVNTSTKEFIDPTFQ